MNRYLPLIVVCLIFASMDVAGQNLVPNPGFESAQRKPQKKHNSINRANGWMAPKYGSDYYYKGSGKHCGTPKNVFGRQKPHSGNAYAGICTRTKFLEYIEAKLLDTLIRDQEYLVEFYISRAERSIGTVKEFGVLFTGKTIWGIESRGISKKPQLVFKKRGGYRNKTKWTKLSAIYKAEGNESVIILGHFNYDPSDDKRRMLCHYYIDDVSVTPINMQSDSVTGRASNDSSGVAKTEIGNSIPPPFEPKMGEAIALKNVFFATNRSELLPGSFSELDKLVTYLNRDYRAYIEISGHTDNTGNEEQNKTLSELRAKAVADYLILKGIDRFRIKYEGYGSSQPLSTNTTDEGRQMNRRVEFIINK